MHVGGLKAVTTADPLLGVVVTLWASLRPRPVLGYRSEKLVKEPEGRMHPYRL